MKKTSVEKKKLKLEAETVQLLTLDDDQLRQAVGGATPQTNSTRVCRPTSDECMSNQYGAC